MQRRLQGLARLCLRTRDDLRAQGSARQLSPMSRATGRPPRSNRRMERSSWSRPRKFTPGAEALAQGIFPRGGHPVADSKSLLFDRRRDGVLDEGGPTPSAHREHSRPPPEPAAVAPRRQQNAPAHAGSTRTRVQGPSAAGGRWQLRTSPARQSNLGEAAPTQRMLHGTALDPSAVQATQTLSTKEQPALMSHRANVDGAREAACPPVALIRPALCTRVS